MKNQLLWAIVMLLLIVTKVSSQCEFEGYNFGGSYNGHVYYVSAGDHSWVDANAEAISLGGYLASISDAAENGFVAAIGSTWGFDAGESDNGQWIGLNDIATEGDFVWSNGESVTYTNWFGGEPNNIDYGDGLGEDWVEINRGEPGAWNDLPAFVDYIESVVEFNDGDCDGFADACDEIFDDADCDGIGDGCDETMDDADCDGIGDACDDTFNDGDCDGMGDACDPSFDDADCDGIGDACDDTFSDADCDGTGDGCDNCPGGDDNGPCDAESFPGFSHIPASWVCHDNGRKVFMCHEGVTICIDASAVPAHLAHGDFLGPCVGCSGGGYVAPTETEIATNESLDRPNFAVSPNPGNGDFTITMYKNSGTVRIYNQNGQLMHRLDGAANQQLNVQLLDEGVYIVQFTTDKETITKKLFVVQK